VKSADGIKDCRYFQENCHHLKNSVLKYFYIQQIKYDRIFFDKVMVFFYGLT